MSTILECKNLSKAYGNKTALSHIDLALELSLIHIWYRSQFAAAQKQFSHKSLLLFITGHFIFPHFI